MRKDIITKVLSSKLMQSTGLLAAVVTLAEVSTQACSVWVLGQDDMPESMIE